MHYWVTNMKRQWNWNVAILTMQKLAVGAVTLGIAASMPTDLLAQQMRSSRGNRPLYPVPNNGQAPRNADNASKALRRPVEESSQDANDEADTRDDSQVVQASATRRSSPTKTQTNTSQAVRATSNGRARLATQRSSATLANNSSPPPRQSNIVRSAGHTQAMEPVPMGNAAPADCPSCQHGSDAMMMDGGMSMEGGCDSCGSCGSCDGQCGCDSFGQGRCLDFGSGPLASTLSWTLSNSYFRFQAANFKPTGADLPILASRDTRAGGGEIDGTAPDATVLFGNQRVNGDSIMGYRFMGGLWMDNCKEKAMEFHGYNVGTESLRLHADSASIGNDVLARPVAGGAQSRVLLSELGALAAKTVTGAIDVNMDTVSYGGAVMLRNRMFQASNMRWDFLLGYQHARLEDLLVVASISNSGATASVSDTFNTLNRFDGMAIGLERFSRFGNFSLDTRFKLGNGNMRRTTIIRGRQVVTPGNIETTQGLLARDTNAGTYVQDRFVVSPEFGITLGYRFARDLDFTIGYTYLSLPKVARAGDQIDVNALNVPETNVSVPLAGNVLPLFNLVESNYSLQSFDFGGQWRF